MKVSVEDVEMIVAKCAPEKAEQIKQELENLLQSLKDEKADKVPKAKKGLLVIQTEDEETAFVAEIEEKFEILTFPDKLLKAIGEHNGTKKGQKLPIKTVADAFLDLKPKATKELGFRVKTKERVYVVKMKNKIGA